MKNIQKPTRNERVVKDYGAVGKYRVRLIESAREPKALVLDIREYIDDEAFQGFTRRGVRVRTAADLARLSEALAQARVDLLREQATAVPSPESGPPFEKGDRISLVSMPNDPCPVLPGTRGTVVGCQKGVYGPNGERTVWQVDVDWDTGRSLMLAVPPDVARKINK